MIRVGVSGAAGRMGRLVAGAVADAEDLTLHGLYDPGAPGVEVRGTTVSASVDALAGADVVVEFTRPDVVMENLEAWRSMEIDAVVGTSGFDEARLAAVKALWRAPGPRCLIVPSFSIGGVVTMRLAELAAPHFDAVEIIELHHDAKVDAPSGTALETARRVAAALPNQERAADSAELVPGARGAEVAGVPVHAVRLPGVISDQHVILGGSGETITISHNTTDRSSFLPGVLLAVRSIAGLPDQVTVGLQSLLDL